LWQIRDQVEASVARAQEIATYVDGQRNELKPAIAEITSSVTLACQAEETLRTAQSTAEDTTQRLEAHAASARSLLAELSAATELRSSIEEELEQYDERAVHALNELREGISQASKERDRLGERLSAAVPVIAELGQTVQNASQTHEDLIGDGEAMLGRLAIRLESIKEIEQRIALCSTATDGVHLRLADLAERLTEAAAAVGEPKRLLGEAQAQSAQLERVCDAAKRVKTTVSQAALAADEQARQLFDAEQDASRRLQELQSDLTEAAATMAQWVEEAQRAQSRLSAAIEACPTIYKTHTADGITGLARTANDLIIRAPKGSGKITPHAQPEAAARPLKPPANRDEEIARVLAEARKARRDVEGAPVRKAVDAEGAGQDTPAVPAVSRQS
jgi:chromosome segregation ATPase